MRIRTLWRLALAASLAGVASFGATLAWYALTTEPERIFPHAIAEPEMIRILVAKQRLQQGDMLTAAHLQWVEWPVASAPDGVFTSVEALFGADHKDKRFVRRTIEPGEPVSDSKVSERNQVGRLHGNLAAGHRAIAICVDAVTLSSGLVAPGDRMDIQLTETRDGGLFSGVIVANVEFLGVVTMDVPGCSALMARQSVTVGVPIREAQLLSLAQQRGRLSLVLRARDPVPQDAPEVLLPPGGFRRDPTRPSVRVLSRQDDRPVHPMLLPPPEAVEDPAGDWVPGSGWPPPPGR